MLVLDANAFINESNFSKLAEKYQFYSHPGALSEVRDLRAKERLQLFAYKLDVRNPSEEFTKFVRNFATQTGDIATLSDVDIEVIALAVQMVDECGQKALINMQPLKPLEFNKIKNVNNKKPKQVEPVEEQSDSDGWEEVVDKRRKVPKQVVIEQEDDVEDSESDCDEEWITNDNIHEKMNDCQIGTNEESKVKVSVLTSDYAMQNVLLQLGIPLLSFEGMRIQSARRHILECYVCKTLVRDSTKLFCPKCGKDSLLKVSCSLNSDGTIVLYRKRNFQINLRGVQFDVSRQQSKKAQPFIHSEDQLLMRGIQQKLLNQKRGDEQRYNRLLKKYENGVGFEEVDTCMRKTQPKIQVGYGNLNPNDVRDMKKIQGRKRKA